MSQHPESIPPPAHWRLPTASSSLARLGRLTRKELSEILRDRRTIITLVLMPMLLYPLLSFAFRFSLANQSASASEVVYVIGFVAEEDQARFSERFALGEQVLARRAFLGMQGKGPAAPAVTLNVRLGSAADLEDDLRAGKLDAIVRNARPPAPPGPERVPVAVFEFVYLSNSAAAKAALAHIDERLQAANQANLLDVLRKTGVRGPYGVMRMVTVPLDDARPRPIMALASLVPLVLILMTITGAVYPAIDLTAGERERGTLEILVAAPVPRLGLLFAKYVSVVAVAVLTALVNLVAMVSTLVLSGLGPQFFEGQGLSATVVVQLFGLLLLFAGFFSAVLLCITSFARSFKEAQAYLIPLMLVALGPGVIGMIPGINLADWAWAPLLNIVLLGRDLLDKGAAAGPALIVIVTTLAYASAAIALAARVFGAESVLYNEQSSWGELFHRPAAPQPCALVSAALWCLALMIPLNFALQGSALLLKQAGMLSTELQILFGPLHTLVLFGVLPALFAWHGRLHMATAFATGRSRLWSCMGGALLGLSLWPVVFEIMTLLEIRLEDWQKEQVRHIAESLRKLPTAVKVTLVVIPAFLEEWFFRGFLYGALRRHAGAATTVGVTALMFGALHVLFRPELGLARLWPSALLGLVLGGVREASGSVWPGVLLHALYNTSLALLLQPDADARESIETWWVFAGLAGSAAGAALIWLGRTPRMQTP